MKKLSRTKFIPPDIVEAILLRLPAKSVARFKSVLKEWNSIISDPRFIKKHTHQLLHQHKKRLLAISRTTKSFYSIELTNDNNNDTIPATAKEIPFDLPPLMSWREIMGSCNGLVLARAVKWGMLLINPTTLDLWKLPVNPFADDTHMYFDRYGFGYDSSTDDYKVVSIWFSHHSISYNNSVSIYSLRNNSWRKLPNTTHYFTDDECALVNGNCHWLTDCPLPSIIAFSFLDELFFKIEPPNSIRNSNFWYTSAVVEIGWSLGVYLCCKSGYSELWVMQEYGDSKSWTRVFSHGDYMRPLCLLQGSYRDIVFVNKDGVAVFNIDEGRHRYVKIIGGPDRFIIQGSFVETIESPKRIITTP